MFTCNRCGYAGPYVDATCPMCRAKLTPSAAELDTVRRSLSEALERGDVASIAECRHILADAGDTEAQKDYASMLEHGKVVTQDLDGAMRYFGLAAQKNDAYACYRYSRLLSRTSPAGSRFWLLYSSVLGCKEAYNATAALFSGEGKETVAAYYCSLAAACEDTEAIVSMAKRYATGQGVVQNDGFAKWYLDRFTFPPIDALKLAFRLRGVRPEEPPMPKHPDYDGLLYALLSDAADLGADAARLYLVKLLTERGDAKAEFLLGKLLAEGVGTEPDLSSALLHLEHAGSLGVADAYLYLADLYITGARVPADADRGVCYYRKAAGLGRAGAYTRLGELYEEGKLVDRDLAYAVELYEKAARDGDRTAGEKATRLKTRREEFYRRALREKEANPEEAFRSFGIAAAMGYLPAIREFASCYENGIGTKKDRPAAFYWYRIAESHGDERARFDVGRCYAYGIGVAFDFKKAARTLTAAKDENAEAPVLLKTLLDRKRRRLVRKLYAGAMELLFQKKFEPAVVLLQGAADQGDPKAIYSLGCCYEFGIGLPVDRDRSSALYETAYAARFRDPRQTYKLRILKMIR